MHPAQHLFSFLVQVVLKCWNVTGEQNGVEREITHPSNIVPLGASTHGLYVAPWKAAESWRDLGLFLFSASVVCTPEIWGQHVASALHPRHGLASHLPSQVICLQINRPPLTSQCHLWEPLVKWKVLSITNTAFLWYDFFADYINPSPGCCKKPSKPSPVLPLGHPM